MGRQYKRIAYAAICASLALAATVTQAGPVTYVDAVGDAGGNTVRASDNNETEWFTTATAADNKWRLRTGQGDGTVYETSSNSTTPEDAVEIKTMVSGLANALYDVYVFFRSQPDAANDWKIRAGFTSNPNANQLYGETTADGAIAGTLALSGPGQLQFAGPAPAEDTGQPLYYANIGQFDVTDGNLAVFIDDLPAMTGAFLEKRSWYEGIGYSLPTTSEDILSVMTGLASSASTWSNNAPPSSANTYRVVNGHIVTVDGPFPGIELRADNGATINFNSAGSGVLVPKIVVEEGGSLTEEVSGDFALGDISMPLGTLLLNGDVSFNIDANSDFFLDMAVTGAGDMNFNGSSGSILWLSNTSDHAGTIRFNGSGDQVKITESNAGVGTLEMNSTGGNRLFWDPEVQSDEGTVIFNQPGIIDHASTQTAPTRRRLHGMEVLTANAPIVADLSKGFPTDVAPIDERRLLIGDALNGSADITVNGTATDITDLNSQFDTTLNEFELGASGDVNPPTSAYSGTLTANNFVNFEVRHNLPNARIVLNSNARMDTGLQTVPAVLASLKTIQVGEIVVNNGATLEVGFEQAPVSGSLFPGETGHHTGHLILTKNDARSGDMTLNDGSTLRMQVNGTDDLNFDRITVGGDVALNGTLNVLVNPPSTTSTANATYTPTVGDTFNIITLAGSAGPADFNDSGAVDGADLDVWETAFGATAAADADGDGDSDGNDFLAWQRSLGAGGMAGAITGDFDAVVVTDPTGAMAGFTFNVVKTAMAVQLVVASAAAAVPEPSSALLVATAAAMLYSKRRRS